MMKTQKFHTFLPALAALALVFLFSSACSSPIIPLTSNSNGTLEPTPQVPSVTVADQALNVDQVVIAEAVSQGPGWIAVHSDDNGNYGPPIGFAPVNNGINRDVVVRINTGDKTPILYAMLHHDEGEVGKYEFPGPDVPVMIEQDHVAPPFNIIEQAEQTGPASLSILSQEIENGKVVIEEVVSAGPGWVAILAQGADGQPGASIGFTRVNTGANQNVSVVIDASQITPVMYAALYKDEGEAGAFEFPGPDGLQQADGQNVIHEFRSSSQAVADIPSQATQTPAETQDSAAVESTATLSHDEFHNEGTATAVVGETAEPTAEPESGGPVAILPEITVANQTLVNESLTVPYVFSLGDAWLVLHFQNPDGTMGNMVGAAYVNDGENTDVVVPVNTGLVTPTIYAMLHFDKGVRGSLEFPGPDEPVIVRGEVLAPAFSVSAGVEEEVIIDTSKEEGRVKHLVNSEGMSLYLSLSDEPGQSNCTEECLEEWQPVLAGLKLTAGVGVVQNYLGVIALPDGSRQVTYLGAPLYTYINDENPGDVNGQGVDGNWFLVAP